MFDKNNIMAKKSIFNKKINHSDFNKFLKKKIKKEIKSEISKKSLEYRIPSNDEKNLILKDIVNKIFLSKVRKSGPKNKEIWEKGWGQNLKNYKKKNPLRNFCQNILIKVTLPDCMEM